MSGKRWYWRLLLGVLLCGGGGCARSRAYYVAERAPTYVLTRVIRQPIAWDALIVVRTKDGLDLVLHPHEPKTSRNDTLCIGVRDRSRKARFLPEETVLIDAFGETHFAAVEDLGPLRSYDIRCPSHNIAIRRDIGAVFHCVERLVFQDLAFQNNPRLRVRFTYQPGGSSEVRQVEVRLKRKVAVY